ncbi:MAG: sel1 repeat family protein [Prevotellaceae bacterium]|nr:sel1 repeat family protein [Candidatus Minthosoma caballi]MBQ0087721.1 sel1 repeat family protein [Candidatus Faecinaster equi]
MKTLKKYWLAVITLVMLPINISAQSLKEKAESGDKEAQYNYARSLEGVDKKKAFQWCMKSAEQGYAPAQSHLGNCYYIGRGITQNYEQAVYWYRKSAEQGNKTAQYNLGICYYNGRGIAENDKQAVYWFRKSAEQGDASAQYALALQYLRGTTGVEKDSIEAAGLLLSSACGGVCEPSLIEYDGENSNSKAREELLELSKLDNSPKQYYFSAMVGCMYDAMQDFYSAEKYYKLAISKGSIDAVRQLGLMYYCLSPCTDPSKRLLDPSETRVVDEKLILKYNKTKEWKENDNAAYWLEEAVRYGEGEIVYSMAGTPVYSILMDTYASGKGMSINTEKAVDVAYTVCTCLMDSTYEGPAEDHAELVLELALTSDVPQLHNKLFNIYSNIYTYVKNNPNGHGILEAIAYRGLGKCYYKGFGVKKDYNKAFNFLSEAAGYDMTGESMRLLAACYRYGRGVKADPNKDKEWSAIAAKCNNEKAKKLQELRSRWGW